MQASVRFISSFTRHFLPCLFASLGLPMLSTPLAGAQSLHFSGAQTTVSQAFSEPARLAIDTSGNIFVADAGANLIYKETPSLTGYQQTVIPTSPLAGPVGVAVDRQNNLFIADSSHNRILKETPTSTGYQESVLPTSGLNGPHGLYADASGALFICDTFNGRVLKETPSGNKYVESVVGSGMWEPNGAGEDLEGNVYIVDFANGSTFKEVPSPTGYTQVVLPIGRLSSPGGIAVDAKNNLYISSDGTNQVFEEKPSGGGYTQTVVASSNLHWPDALALDSQGNLYIADVVHHRVLRQQFAGAEFGAVAIASSPSAPPLQSLVFTFDTAGKLSSAPIVSRQGNLSSDFTLAPSSTCAVNTSYAAGSSCTIDITFAPTLAGSLSGAGVLPDGSGAILASGYVHGTGTGPMVNFSPAVETVIGSGLHNPRSIAADLAGNLYIADTDNLRIVKEMFSGGSYTQSVLPTSSLQWPLGVAVDGNGNVYVSDTWHSRELKEAITPTAAGSTVTATPVESVIVSTGLNYPAGIAVDGAGNFYLADSENNRVLMESPSGNGYLASTLPFTGLNNIYGVAVDGSGSLYLADSGNNRILKETYAGGVYTQSLIPTSALGFPRAVAVDANGDVFIADTNNGRVLEELLNNGNYSESVVRSGLASPDCLTLDGNGNLYIADTANGRVLKEAFATPPALQFASTAVGSASVSQIVTLTNVGNAALAFPSPTSGSNPAISTGFSFDPTVGNACPAVSAGHDPGADLNPGESCVLSTDFAPQTAGAQQGDLVLSDTNLNAASALQSFALSGTAVGDVVHLTLTAPASATYGNPVQVVAQLSNTSNQDAIHAGAVAFSDQSSVFGTQTVANAQVTQAYLASGVGTVSLHATFTPSDASLDSASGSALLQITPAPLNISAADATRTYGAANPQFTGSVLGAVNTDSFRETFQTSAVAASPVASYAITPSVTGTRLSNYMQNIQVGQLHVTPAALTAAASNATRTYGSANPVFRGSVTGALNGDVLTESFSTLATPASPVGGYAIVPAVAGPEIANYAPTLQNGTLTVTQAALTAAANDATRPYGASNPQFTGTILGAVNGDVLNESFTTNATAASPVATYSIVPAVTGSAAGNYTPTLKNGTLTVTPAELTVRASDAARVYGASNPTFTGVLTGAVDGDVLSESFTTTATPASAPGTYAIVPSAQGAAIANYAPTLLNGTLTVTPAALTLTVQNESRVYGTPNPAFTGYVAGTVNGDSFTETFHTAATQPSPVGSYPITATVSGRALADYSIATAPGVLTVTPAPLTVIAASAQRSYGAPNPVFAGTLSGAVPGDVLNVTYATTAGAAAQAGQYPIHATVSGAALVNYTLNAVDGVLTIAQLTTTTSLASQLVAATSGSEPQITLLATVQPAQATQGATLPAAPTGMVRFYNGKQLMGNAALEQGVATFVTTQFPIGSASQMTAVYQGDVNFEPSSSTAIPVQVNTGGFWIKPMPASTAAASNTAATASLVLTVESGQLLSLPLQVGPGASGMYPGKVTFSVQGLPVGATFTFSPSTLAADSGIQTVTLTVQTPTATTAQTLPAILKGLAPTALALILLPFTRARTLRSVGRRLALICLVLAGSFAGLGLTGCGFTSTAWSKAAATPQTAKPASYPLTVTMNTGGQQTTLSATLMVGQ